MAVHGGRLALAGKQPIPAVEYLRRAEGAQLRAAVVLTPVAQNRRLVGVAVERLRARVAPVAVDQVRDREVADVRRYAATVSQALEAALLFIGPGLALGSAVELLGDWPKVLQSDLRQPYLLGASFPRMDSSHCQHINCWWW